MEIQRSLIHTELERLANNTLSYHTLAIGNFGYICQEHILPLSNVIMYNTSLRTLNLWCSSRIKTTPLLEKALCENTTLKSLRVQTSIFRDESEITRILLRNSTLSKLTFIYTESATKRDIESLASGIQVNSSLQKLSFQNYAYQLYDAPVYVDVSSLLRAMRVNTSIKHFEMDLCSRECDQDIVSLIAQNTTLTCLSISWFEEKSYSAVCNALKCNTTITSLGLCPDDVDGITPIVEMLTYNSTISHLDLSHSCFTCVEDLFNVLKTNRTLTSLDLQGLEIGDFDEIVDMLEYTSLTNLLVSSPYCDPPYKQIIDQKLEMNKHNNRKRHASLYMLMYEGCKEYW